MRHLCDSNFWIAATISSHPHHPTAREWMDSSSGSLAFCRSTQISFLRLLTTEAMMREDVRTNSKAIALLNDLLDHPRCEFIENDPPGLSALWLELAHLEKSAPKMLMDAYLAALAVSLSLRFVTFDKGFERYKKSGLDLLLLKG